MSTLEGQDGTDYGNGPDALDVARDAAVDEAIRRDEQNPMISTRELACILIKKQYDECTEVLEWASEHVWRIEPHRKDIGGWFCIASPNASYSGPTLYAALHSAWEGRDRET